MTFLDCFVWVTAIFNRLRVSIRNAVRGDPFGGAPGPRAGVLLAGEEEPGGAALVLAEYLRCRTKIGPALQNRCRSGLRARLRARRTDARLKPGATSAWSDAEAGAATAPEL